MKRDPVARRHNIAVMAIGAEVRYGRARVAEADIERIAAFASIHERHEEYADAITNAVALSWTAPADPTVGYGEAWA